METTNDILGLDVGGTNFRMGLVDANLRVRELEVVPSASVCSAGDTPRAIARLIQDYCARKLGRAMPRLVSAGFPSVVDGARRRLFSSTNFPGLDGVDIVSVLERELHVPVCIEHDAYFLLACDIWKLKLPTEGVVLGFYFGTGMGNAMFLSGLPYVGKNGAACEVGHMPMGQSAEVCSCGNTGCVEMHCCGKALERLAQRHFPGTPIGRVFAEHANTPVLREFVRCMAVPVATEVNVLDPAAVVLGGGIVAMEGFPREALFAEILAHTRKPYPAANLDIRFTDGAVENGIIGAALEGARRLG